MGKVNSTYPHLLGGVSQLPFSRRPMYKHSEQVNMIPDPVLGLTRRPGSIQRDVETLTGGVALDAEEWQDLTGFVGFDFQTSAADYTLFVRSGSLVSGSGVSAVAVCLDKTNRALIPVSVKGGDTVADTIRTAGASSGAAVGAMVVLAGNGITPAVATTYPWAIEDNQKRAVIWVRGGAYKRRYRIAIVRGNQKLWVEYTTKDAAYPARLDTSDLDPGASDYLKRVNDRTNAYNTAATQWINSALADIAPENIATRLADVIREANFLPDTAGIEVVGSNVVLTDASIEDVEADDGGDGNLIRAVGNVVGAPELLTTLGFPGKVVKVRPGNSTDGQVFYLKARAKDGSSGAVTQVTWEEAAGEVSTPSATFVFATVAGGVCYVSSDIDWINTNAGTNFPTYQVSIAGDLESNPPPEFFGTLITNVAVFQDRLVVSKANGYVATSRPGDYLNFFRQSVLTVVDDDPVDFAIIGGESDTVRHSLMYDRNLVLIGNKKQYLISGKQKLAPGSASATVMASIPGTAGTAPVLVEDRLFYAKAHNGYGSLHWFQPGRIAESPETYEASLDLDTYIAGDIVELVPTLTPDILFARTRSTLDTAAQVFLYNYGTNNRGERISACHRWSFDAALGPIIGLSQLDGELFIVRAHENGANISAVVDTISLQDGANERPYLDSQASSIVITPPLKAKGAAGDYTGSVYSALTAGEYGGWPIECYVTLTSPSIQSQSGPMSAGDLIVSSLDIDLANAGGVVVQVDSTGVSWGGYLRGREAYVAPVYPEVDCSEDGFPACAGAAAEPPPEQFTHYVVVDKDGSGEWTVGTPMTIASGVPYTGYLLTHPDNPNVYGPEYNVGAASLVDDGEDYMRPLAEGASRALVSGNTTAQVHIPLVADGTVTSENLGDRTRFTTSSGEVYDWTEVYAAGEFTYTITRVTAAGPECEPCEPLTPVVVSDDSFLGDSIAHEERRMSLSDAGSPTTANPITDAAPYEQVTLHLPVGRRAGQYRATIAAYHWAPLTITSIDWTGQYHNRTRRV